MNYVKRLVLVTIAIGLGLGQRGHCVAADWPSWRGPYHNGWTDEANIPTRWSPEDNIRWRVKLPGPGNSSPIAFGNRVWITQFTKESNTRELHCYDLETGGQLWVQKVEVEDNEPTHPTNPYCAASPVTDGKHVLAFFGSAGLYCYDTTGIELWHQELGSPQHLFGQGASPTIHGDLVTLNFGPGVEQFWATFRLSDGQEIWRLEIPTVDAPNPFDEPNGPKLPPGTKLRDPFGSWATPMFIQGQQRQELILAFPGELRSVQPATGKKLWSCAGLANQILTTPILTDEGVVCLGGAALAVELGGTGDVTESHRRWYEEEDRGRIGTGVARGKVTVANTMQGIVECIRHSDGKRLWQQRLTASAAGGSWSSIVACGDHYLATNKDGSVYVFKAQPEYEELSLNRLNEPTNATPAITGDSIIIRTDKHLWCIGN